MKPLDHVRTPEDIEAVARALMFAFAGTIEGTREWVQTLLTPGEVRVLRDGPRVAACLGRVPMGQYFGGRSVALLGVAGVAVAPEDRGKGFAKGMMQQFVRDAAAEGWPLAGLYASTASLYRGVGFEHAGHRFMHTVPLTSLAGGSFEGTVEHVPDVTDEIRSSYARFAAPITGMLDRGPYMWSRVKKFRTDIYEGYVVRGPSGEIEGHTFLRQIRKPETGRQSLALTELVIHTPLAARRLLGFFESYAMMGDEMVFFGGPTHPLLVMLPQTRFKSEFRDYSYLRVLNVQGALEARGWGRDGRLEFELTDELVPTNAGRWTLEVHSGQAKLTRGGSGALSLSVRALAVLYAGFLPVRSLAAMGWAQGDERALSAADNLFPVGLPWMVDMY